jgi:DNA gyrase/topoisomerase IV subunit A
MMGGLPPDGLPYCKVDGKAALLIEVSKSVADAVDAIPAPYSVEVWPACADGLAPNECTPENYAHLKARLVAAADNLAREVRANQAAALVRADLERDLQAEVDRLAAELAAALSEISDTDSLIEDTERSLEELSRVLDEDEA